MTWYLIMWLVATNASVAKNSDAMTSQTLVVEFSSEAACQKALEEMLETYRRQKGTCVLK